MFVVNVTYVMPLEQVDDHLAVHVEFLKKYYEKGIFVASGRKVPRVGGVILARSVSREELNHVLDQDPFKQAGVAEYEVTEFVASMAADGLSSLKEG
jgi:uncharacterized protein YciI